MVADVFHGEVEIVRLGAQGDGVAVVDGQNVFVPFALPGERWRSVDGAWARLTDSSERSSPFCRHYGQCGGCMAQHMGDNLYASWKEAIVRDAFQHRGISADVRPLTRVARHSRRRAFLGVERRGTDVLLGFREEGRHALVDMTECPVLDGQIVQALPALRSIARIVMDDRVGGRLVVTRADQGIDARFENARRDLSPVERSEVAALAQRSRLVRLSLGDETLVQTGSVAVAVGEVEIEPSPGVFLQAVPPAEQVLIGLVEAALPKRAKKALDLFSGVGTFAFPLAKRAAVTAFDGDKRAIAALIAAQRKVQGLKPIDARVRDLFSEPLSVRELDAFDVVVFDPPRAGAHEQAQRIAKSNVPVVIAVSCNPASLARDARALIDGGYTMGPVSPVDQFQFSPHVEAVTVFARR